MGVDVGDIEFQNNNGWLEFGFNATPQTFLDIQDKWVSYKTEFDRIEAGVYQTQKWGSVSADLLFLQE